MSTLNTVKAQLQNLIDTSNRTTGKSDTDLTGAVNTLINERNSMLDGSITEIYSDVTELGEMGLAYNPNLISITLPNVTVCRYLSCSYNVSLKNVNLPLATNFGSHVFFNTTGLESISLPSAYIAGSSMFGGCSSLKFVNLHKAIIVNKSTFVDCVELKTLILSRTSGIASLSDVNAFNNTPIASGTGYIYVPRAQIENYKTATNWTTFASQFRTLEDYTVDGTIEGELDWDKVNGGTA